LIPARLDPDHSVLRAADGRRREFLLPLKSFHHPFLTHGEVWLSVRLKPMASGDDTDRKGVA